MICQDRVVGRVRNAHTTNMQRANYNSLDARHQDPLFNQQNGEPRLIVSCIKSKILQWAEKGQITFQQAEFLIQGVLANV